ncbi:COX15/CtaA family protein [Bacillus sp. EB106-08-02-XG196]|uniref:COX15/CtaA family protein n=1 Tax=Bacillus sp. EB106-08-02-XG196 TaxID=2737049 RepID=UPI0015C43D09|nr:COX15/CtaA family protein [Bacillus sp. EB106-08-02-XG196]NWQ43253.1 COX15/CtaA family protein [Bacillus sp. EB106-08-02-XG196]
MVKSLLIGGNIIKLAAIISVLLTYILIVFGGYVASSESGMGCGPEWPLCNGEVIPILENETLIEFAHRAIGLLLAILVGTLFVLIKRNKNNKILQTAGNWLISLLTLQILAGAVVVVLDLPTIIITVHLLVAMLFMLVLLWIYRTESHTRIETKLSDNRKLNIVFQLNVLIILLLLTMGFGAFIKHEYYGLVCGWLDCRETLLPVTTPEILQTGHRILAVITAAYTILLMFKAYLNNWGQGLKVRLLLAATMVVIQIISGILTIITNISIPWAVVHLAIGTALFMIVADTRLIVGLTIAKNTGKPWTDKKGQPFGK